MSDELRPDLSLPEAPPAPPRPSRGRLGGSLIIVALGAILFLQYRILVRPAAAPPEAPASSIDWRAHALKLGQRNLHDAAARAWQRHLDTLPASDREGRGKILYQIAGELMLAGDYQEAVSSFWQAERLLGFSSELAPKIAEAVGECLERLGKFDEKDREMRERAVGGAVADAAGEIAAEIGLEKITMHELERRIARDAELQLSWQYALPPEQEKEIRKQLAAQYEDPSKKLGRLYELVAQQLLYRRGRELEIDKAPELQELLGRTKAQLVAAAVVARDLKDKIKPSAMDLGAYFSANREKFQTPPRATVRVVPLPSKEEAEKLIAAATTEDALAAAAVKDGKDGSIVAERIAPQDPIGGLGPVPALSKAIFAAKEPGLLPAPVEAGGAFFVVFVRALEPPATPEFEAVKGQVLDAYYQEKQRELQETLVKELFAKYGALVHDDVVLRKKPPAAEKQPEEQRAQ